MIKNIKIKNFKSFKKTGEIDVGKINVFVGPNSSGKSSFIQGLLLLKNAIECIIEKHYKNLEGDFRSLVYDKNTDNKLMYGISFDEDLDYMKDLDLEKIKKDFPDTSKDDIIRVSKHYDAIRLKDMSVTLEVVDENNDLISDGFRVDTFEVNTENNINVRIYSEDNRYKIKLNDNEINDLDISNICKFYFKLRKKQMNGLDEDLKDQIFISYVILEKLENILINFSNKLLYMTSYRTGFHRSENINNSGISRTVGSKGQYTLNALMNIDKYSKNDSDSNYKKSKIDYWLDEFDLGDKIEVKEGEKNNYSIMIRNKYLDIYNNILDVGVGTSQLLPLIIESVNSKEGSMIIIEEPETHIHPKAQAKLSDLFVRCANDDNKKFIIETHSIFLVTQLQILIASEEISAEDVKVYFFDQDKEGTEIKEMVIAENGQFEDEWPSGFFDIHYELGKKLFEMM